jgi:hypothetical protein
MFIIDVGRFSVVRFWLQFTKSKGSSDRRSEATAAGIFSFQRKETRSYSIKSLQGSSDRRTDATAAEVSRFL